jgi:prevent-host-death family protein
MSTTIPLSEAKTRLPQILRELANCGNQVFITRSGRPAGVLLSVEEYEGLLETLDILADGELAAAIRQGLGELTRGESLSDEEVWGELDAPVRS